MAHYPKPFFKKARGLWYVEINRRQVNLGPERSEAFQQYHQLMRQPTEIVASPDALAVVIDSFLEWVHRNRAPDTYEWYRYRLQRLVLKYPDMRIASLKPYHIEKWVDGYDVGKTSRRNYFRSIKTCLRWAVNQGYIEKNPIAQLAIPSAERRDVFLTPEGFAELLTFVRDESAREALEVAYLTGCRPQELLRVTAQHFERENARWVFPQNQAKGKMAPRIVYLADKALEIATRLSEKTPAGPLFRNAKGKPWTPDAMNCLFDRVQSRMGMVVMREEELGPTAEQIREFSETLRSSCIRKGVEVRKSTAELRHEAKEKLTGTMARSLVPRYSLYSLRHSWATNALRNQVDPLTVAILMGHKDPSTLARVYQHLAHSPEHMLDQARKAVN